MNEELKNTIIKLETELHKNEVRTDAEKLNVLLSDDFFEIGTSGNSYTKNDILNRLPNEEAYEVKSYDFELREIADNVIQVFYKTESLGRKSFRNSIWLNDNSSWKMVFHQGTKLS